MERNTRQKNIIKEYLMSVKSHPSAEEVYLAARKEIPTISKGTVYRILKSFVENREAQEIPLGVSRFDGESKEHAHFICRQCGLVADMFDNKTRVTYNKDSKIGNIDSFQLSFYGKCNNCLRSKKHDNI